MRLRNGAHHDGHYRASGHSRHIGAIIAAHRPESIIGRNDVPSVRERASSARNRRGWGLSGKNGSLDVGSDNGGNPRLSGLRGCVMLSVCPAVTDETVSDAGYQSAPKVRDNADSLRVRTHGNRLVNGA